MTSWTGKSAQSTIPTLLHLTLDPLIHKPVALIIENSSRAFNHPFTSLYCLCHLLASISDRCLMRKLASSPSVDTINGEKKARLSSLASLFIYSSPFIRLQSQSLRCGKLLVESHINTRVVWERHFFQSSLYICTQICTNK